MSDVLTRICIEKRSWIKRAKKRYPEGELLKRKKFAEPTRGFRSALTSAVARSNVAIVAELKKASPSKGLIRKNFIPAELASDYKSGGATCLSVLTDVDFFQGSDNYLMEARDSTTLPVLRKDFILDPYQVIESRSIGADCILLIMASIGDDQSQELMACAKELDMDVLVEIHDEKELERALKISGEFLVGINNRNLRTLEVNLQNTERLAPQVPSNYQIISESGISSPDDIKRIQDCGVNRFLVGETLMLQENLVEATRALLGYKESVKNSDGNI